jgi:hypothetical protein
MKGRTARLAGGASVLLAALALAAGELEVEERGIRFVVPPAGGASRILAAPDTQSAVVASPPLGYRVRYAKKRVLEGAPVWYFVSTPGFTPGWMEASLLAERLPAPPAPKRIVIDPRDGEIFSGRAALTSAGRGLDARAVQFAQRKEQAGGATFGRATAQFRGLFKQVSRIMADVAHDGETKDATGKAHPSGMMNEVKTADGRLRAGDAFKRGMK